MAEFHTHHVHYNFEYLGDNWNAPRFPWHVALVTTLFTVPVATLAAAVDRRRRVDRARGAHESIAIARPALLLALSAAASIGPFFLGSTPIFGAEKHWMPALPTICIAAGVGAVWAARRSRRRVRERVPERARDRDRGRRVHRARRARPRSSPRTRTRSPGTTRSPAARPAAPTSA